MACADEVASSRAAQGVPKPSQGLQKLKADLLELEARTPDCPHCAAPPRTSPRTPHCTPNQLHPTDPHVLPTSSQDYIPWNAVATNWANRRAVWARRLRDCMDTSGVVKHLLQLEQEQPSPLTCVCSHQGTVCSASRLLHSAVHIQLWSRPQTA